MPLDARLREMLVCPQCKGGLAEVDGGQGLLCDRCRLQYPVRSGIPVMLLHEALDLRTGQNAFGASSVKLARATFRVIAGPDVDLNFQVEPGTCRAIGRGAADPNRTAVFNVDIAMALDDGTRNLVLQYIARQYQKGGGTAEAGAEQLGIFRRTPDIVLSDRSLSRLHAMVFSDGEKIAILDLVSKNGTYVNGQEIESKMLVRGDTIELGDTTIAFEK